MSVRRATPADLDALMSMERTIFPDDAWSPEQMAEALASPYAHYVVVERNGEIIGYAGAFHLPGDEVADVHTIAVSASARGHGVGSELFDELMSWCVSEGARRILLEVRSDNLPAHNLYQSRGFQTIAIREGYYQPANVDALVMEKVVA